MTENPPETGEKLLSRLSSGSIDLKKIFGPRKIFEKIFEKIFRKFLKIFKKISQKFSKFFSKFGGAHIFE